jgi:hypothetical protein
MQIRGGDQRAFNPDRDMVWALPRLFKRALDTMGENIAIDDLRKMIEARGVDLGELDDPGLVDALAQVIKDIAKYFNVLSADPLLHEKAQPFFGDVFRKEAPYQQIRLFLADILMSQIFAELPTWYAMINPRSPNDPLPSVGEAEDAADVLIAGLNASIGKESDHA